MTGYGRGVVARDGVCATVDVRAVNHRFLDLKLRGAAIAPALEDAITARVRAAIERGAVAVSLHLARDAAAASVRIDGDAARHAHEILSHAAASLGLAGPDLALVLAQPGVVVFAGTEVARDVEANAILAALDAALVQLDQMRSAEGIALAAELATQLRELDRLRATIARLAASVPQHLSKRIHERVNRLLEDRDASSVDPSRLAQEIAILADRADVTEELVRLASHADQARGLLASTTAAGRRLDFLVQEIGRELNTIGSKSTAAEITSAVVEAKAALEKLREQVQNVE